MRFRALPILTMLLAACSRGHVPAAAQPSSRPDNVLLITIDSLRADHVGAYGDVDARTPALDALAAGGVRFDRAYTTAPLTLPAHASLLTGRFPPRHGARFDGTAIDAAAPLVAESFHRAGFATAAFVGAPALDRRFGLARGFDAYESAAPDQVDARAIAWLDAHKARRVFVWVHLFAPHAPYGNPADRARTARPAPDRYDDDVTAADAQLGRLIAASGPRRPRTLVLVTSDNGEAFGEHGEITHGLFVYDATLRVPLVANGPSIEPGRVVTNPVSLVDVAPTLAALSGLPRFDADGEVILPPERGSHLTSPNQRHLYAETFAPMAEFGWSPLRSVRRGDWKYIDAPQAELYDLKNDPGETRNLVGDQPARAAELAREIDAIAPADAASSPARPDPKDRREIAARLAEVTSGELRGPLLERALREIIRDDPGNGVANLRLGEILAESNRCREAVKRFRLAIAAHTPGAETSAARARCQ